MESVSRSSEDEEEFVRRQGSSLQGELTVRVDSKNGDNRMGTPTTPRSKHSATEQRRRCKINERFQMLRDLIPHSDQKRDRATFLLEVIEYVKFLQEKVQKYESTYPEWNPDNSKLMPWSSNRVSAEGMSDMSQVARNGNASGYTFSGKFIDNGTLPGTPNAILSNSHALVESDLPAENMNVVPQQHPTWQREVGPSDCAVNANLLPEQDELAIDEGTITVSSIYSQNLFGALTSAMESSGIDLSQASVTVQVNLGKRASRTIPPIISNSKDHNGLPHGNQVMDTPTDQVSKRHKLNKC